MPETIRNYIIGFVIAFLLLGLFIILLAALYARRQKKNRKDRLEMQSQFDKTLLHSQLEIKEQTLQHVSHELHDNLGQVASLIKINLHTLKLDDPEKSVKKIEDTKELTKQLITDIKSLSVSLGNDRISHLGFSKAVEMEVQRLNATGAFTAVFRQEGRLPQLEIGKSIILYRMVQEVLNNMIKHSQARQIEILLEGRETGMILVLTDDGIGFNVEEKLTSGGAGLHNLRSRANLISAQLTIVSAPASGTQITIKLPL
jgi:hypothetical protein